MSLTEIFALALALFSAATIGQQQSQPLQTPPADAHVYDLGRDIAPPTLIPEPSPIASSQQCSEHLSGKVILNMEVDTQGAPASFYFVDPLGNELDRLALTVAEQDRFNPATRNGAAVAVRQSVEMNLDGCIATAVDISGKQIRTIRLKAQPSQRIGHTLEPHPRGNIINKGATGTNGASTAPIPLVAPEARFTEWAVQKNITGTCLVSLTVDAHGMPQNPRVMRPLGYGLDETAIEAIQNYRFVPAMHQGKPAPVLMSILVNFRR